MKCIVRDGAQALFVRHTYGRRSEWELPEMREELGVELRDLREVVRVEVAGMHKRTLLHCFEAAVAGGAPVRLAEAEIAEACWAPLDAPPQPLGKHAQTLLARRRGAGEPA